MMSSLFYVLLFFILTYLLVKWRRYCNLEQEKQRLEKIIKERTKEIKEKNRQLVEQSKKLEEIDKVKSRFFADISHEFRTPLTLIMGPLEQMLSDEIADEIEQKKKLTLMLRNSQRLLGLINQLLDFSKLETGSMNVRTKSEDIIPLLRRLVYSFNSLAETKHIDLIF